MSPSKTADRPVYNTFTKSYRTRYVVHGSRNKDEKTLCGRTIEDRSREPFDRDADRACAKCVQQLDIEARIHPGFKG